MNPGRPPKFKTAAALEAAGNAYIEATLASRQPLTVTGLALALGTTRQTLLEYEGEVEGREKPDPRFADAVKRLKTIIENYAETQLFLAKNAGGPIFALKNFGWRDRTELSGPNGEPLPQAVTNINISNATADELLGILTQANRNNTQRAKRPGKAGRSA